jgi:hypothetical protein
MLRRDVKVLANEPIEQILGFDGVPLCGDETVYSPHGTRRMTCILRRLERIITALYAANKEANP